LIKAAFNLQVEGEKERKNYFSSVRGKVHLHNLARAARQFCRLLTGESASSYNFTKMRAPEVDIYISERL
jgi:hypothetical protein